MKAPRAFPTCSGPVGLADTNSTLTERAGPATTLPHAAGSARIAAMVDFERAVAEPQVEEAWWRDLGRGDRCAVRIAFGFRGDLSGEGRADGEWRHPVRPGELHRQVAREVSVGGSAGRSTSTVGRAASSGQAGSAPAATARSQARPTAAPNVRTEGCS